MHRTNRSKGSEKKITKLRRINYRNELNSQNFMYIAHIADYVSGVFGYDISTANAHFNKIKWNVTPLPLIMSILMYPLIILKVFDELRRDIYEALPLIPVLMSASLTGLQRFRTFYLEMELKEIQSDTFKLWDEELQNGIDDEIVKSARKRLSYSKLYAIISVILLILYLLRPFRAIFVYYILNGNDSFIETHILPVAYPFETDTVRKWILCSIWEAITVIYTAMTVISTDLLFIQTCAILSLQIQVLGNKMTNVVKRNDGRDDDCELVKRLDVLGEQHGHIIILCKRLQDAYNPVMLALLITSSISLCSCAIGVEKELSRNNFGAASVFLVHCTGFFIQTCTYCNSTTNVCYWLENISQKIYESQWFGHSIKFQKRVALIMLRSNMEFEFTAYGLYNVDLEELKKIIILAYNLLMGIRKIRSLKTA